MSVSNKHAAISSEVHALRRQQVKATTDATFLGWTRDGLAAFEQRANRIQELLRELAILDTDIP